jgi:hypothetical protein
MTVTAIPTSTTPSEPDVDPGSDPYVEPEPTDPALDPGAEPYTDPDPDEIEPEGAPDEEDPDA